MRPSGSERRGRGWPGRPGVWLAATLFVVPTASADFGDYLAIQDPQFPAQWPLLNTGQAWPFGCPPLDCQYGTPDADIDWTEAYDAGFRGAGVVIALAAPAAAPTVHCLHPDIAPRLWVNAGEIPSNGLDDDGNGVIDDYNGAAFTTTDPPDPNNPVGSGDVCVNLAGSSHDTAVARLALGEANTSDWIGVAPEAELMLVRWIQDVDNRAFYEVVLPYVEAAGARVVFVPYTGVPLGPPVANPTLACNSAATEAGINRSLALATSNVVVIWGRPDASYDPVFPSDFEYPACDANALGVGWTDQDDLSGASSIFVDIAAPGARPEIAGTAPSWAIPHAAGALALLLDEDPTLSRSELVRRLTDSADQVGPNPYPGGTNDEYGHGRLNVFGALLLGDVDGDGVAGDGDNSGVVGDAPCAGGSVFCDDNCPLAVNPGQADTGGLNQASSPDGTGDVCECGDVDDDGAILQSDVDVLRDFLAGLPSSPVTDKCNVTGLPGSDPALCSVDDLVVLRRNLLVAPLAPALEPICGRALP